MHAHCKEAILIIPLRHTLNWQSNEAQQGYASMICAFLFKKGASTEYSRNYSVLTLPHRASRKAASREEASFGLATSEKSDT
jgi:hypothetical protein